MARRRSNSRSRDRDSGGFGRMLGMIMFLVLAGGGVFGGYAFISNVRSDTGAGEDHSYQGAPTHLVIGLDLSQSNILVSNENFARKVADRIRPMIEDLPPRSRVTLRTFGSYDSRSNPVHRDWTISAQSRPEEVARFIHGVVRGVPSLIRDGRLRSQGYTNILAFMENTAQLVDCYEYDVIVVLATDGVEDSEYVRLQRANASLPSAGAEFEGCRRMEMLGVGQGLGSPSTTTRLRREWDGWADEAGFQRFVGLNDW